MAHERERDSDKVVASTSLLQQRTKQNEQKHQTRRNPQRDPEYPFRGQVVVRHAFGQTRPFVRNDFGHQVPTKGVGNKNHTNHHQWWSKRTSRRLQNKHDADDRDHQIGRGRQARTLRQLTVEQKDIHRTERSDGGQYPILDWDIAAR